MLSEDAHPSVLQVVFGAENAALPAVQEAKKYSGTTITMAWEAGLQSLDPLNYSGPRWEKLTGTKVKVIEERLAELYTKIMLEYRAGTSAHDVFDVVLSWMADPGASCCFGAARRLLVMNSRKDCDGSSLKSNVVDNHVTRLSNFTGTAGHRGRVAYK